MSIAVVAEKPSVARDLARVLGAEKRGEGYLHGNGYVVTWAIGHLVGLAEPHEIRPEWRSFRREHLPILPERWPLVVSTETQAQFEVVRKILTSPHVERVICATDAGRRGKLGSIQTRRSRNLSPNHPGALGIRQPLPRGERIEAEERVHQVSKIHGRTPKDRQRHIAP